MLKEEKPLIISLYKELQLSLIIVISMKMMMLEKDYPPFYGLSEISVSN